MDEQNLRFAHHARLYLLLYYIWIREIYGMPRESRYWVQWLFATAEGDSFQSSKDNIGIVDDYFLKCKAGVHFLLFVHWSEEKRWKRRKAPVRRWMSRKLVANWSSKVCEPIHEYISTKFVHLRSSSLGWYG